MSVEPEEIVRCDHSMIRMAAYCDWSSGGWLRNHKEITVSDSPKLRGSCLCGSITFTATNIERKAGNCHCTMCRKFHGAAFATLASLPKADLRWLSGESLVSRYTASNGTVRQFCKDCGSSLTFEMVSRPDHIELAISTLDDAINFEPDVHIFTGFGANWYEPSDGLPCFAAGRDSKQIK